MRERTSVAVEVGSEYLVSVRESCVLNPEDPEPSKILERYPVRVIGVDNLITVAEEKTGRVLQFPRRFFEKGTDRGSIIILTPIDKVLSY